MDDKYHVIWHTFLFRNSPVHDKEFDNLTEAIAEYNNLLRTVISLDYIKIVWGTSVIMEYDAN